jgi:hypothetical protein
VPPVRALPVVRRRRVGYFRSSECPVLPLTYADRVSPQAPTRVRGRRSLRCQHGADATASPASRQHNPLMTDWISAWSMLGAAIGTVAAFITGFVLLRQEVARDRKQKTTGSSAPASTGPRSRSRSRDASPRTSSPRSSPDSVRTGTVLCSSSGSPPVPGRGTPHCYPGRRDLDPE